MQSHANGVGATCVGPGHIFNLNLTLAKVILTLAVLLGVSGCEFVYLHYSDCSYYDGPRFDRDTLRQPVLNQVYSDQVRVTLDNDSHIEDHDIRYELNGSLPPGISYFLNDRSIIFEGAAIRPGSYSFTMTVEARYFIRDRFYYYFSDYCTFRTSRNYLMTVEPF